MASFDFTFTFLNDGRLPLLIQPKEEKQADLNHLLQFLREENSLFKAHLLNYGALLFRGFQITSAEHFHEVITACRLGKIFNYDKCAVPRTKIQEGIYTSVNSHPRVPIPVHSEKSYDPEFPDHIYFNCLQVAETGGFTPLVDTHKLWLSLPETLQEKLKAKGIMYRKFYYGDGLRLKFVRAIGKGINCGTWMEMFQTENKNKVEDILHKTGHQFRWIPKGRGLITELIMPAFRYHPLSNKIVWFNQSDHRNYYHNGSFGTLRHMVNNPISRFIMSQRSFLPYVTLYGDGEPISKREADWIDFAIQKNKLSTPWQLGDIIVVDNYSCMHGKEPHTGERLVLAGMTKAQDRRNVNRS